MWRGHDVTYSELGALITDKQSRIATNTARITELEALIVDKQNRIAALNPDTRAARIAELEALIITHQERIESLTTRNGELTALITAHETRITGLNTRNTELAALITVHETRVTELTDRNAELASLITGHEERSIFLGQRNEVLTTQRETFQAELDALLATGCNDPAAGSNVTFLHSDHLGRPKFATNANGDIVWDEGITTPFGIQITAMAAQTQALMFPGQYEDLETTGAGVTLSHNWHRTYDPMLGRYLQSDPIGLAGGLNRYAYVGGNPNSLVDPTGEIGIVGALVSIGTGFIISKLTGCDYTLQDALLDGALGFIGGGGISKLNKLYRINKAHKIARGRNLTRNPKASKGIEEYVGPGSNRARERMSIKHRPAVQAKGKHSQYPRIEWRTGRNTWKDPFSGKLGGPTDYRISHVPLEPKWVEPAAGAVIGAGRNLACEC